MDGEAGVKLQAFDADQPNGSKPLFKHLHKLTSVDKKQFLECFFFCCGLHKGEAGVKLHAVNPDT